MDRRLRVVPGEGTFTPDLAALVGESPPMREVKELLRKVATSKASTVLLTGESGTGKDLAAKCVHHASERAGAPFMNITCSALTDTLLESELFGHEAGAFTDAKRQHKGLLELADGGTVFLDEIAEMTPTLQAKLLRFLEEKTFKRVGGSTDVSPDVRIVAATHKDLGAAMRAGTFREDLYYRLSVLPVHLPPLRERPGDVALLLARFIEHFGVEFHKQVSGVTPAALQCLECYAWPGNVRELRNVIERAMLLTSSPRIDRADLPPLRPGDAVAMTYKLPAGGVDLEVLDRELVVQALERTEGNQTRAGALLGLNRDQIRYRIEKYSLVVPSRRATPAPFPRARPLSGSVRGPAAEPRRASEPPPDPAAEPGAEREPALAVEHDDEPEPTSS